MADESWSGLIGAQQARQTVYGQVPAALIISETGKVVRLGSDGMTNLAMHALQWHNPVYPI